MAEKFGGSRWVKEGWLDNRVRGVVVGRMTFAAIGQVDVCLDGDFKPDIAGRMFAFTNTQFSDDPAAASRLLDFAAPHTGVVSLISFDPHPLLEPHPYIEWFSADEDHYRIELREGDARLLNQDEAARYEEDSRRIRQACAGLSVRPSATSGAGERPPTTAPPDPSSQEWF